jgi:two-component system, response regulator
MDNSSSLSILIVEDNQDHADLLSEIMSILTVKHTLSYAENGIKALEKLESKNQSKLSNSKLPEIIFLDIKMPEMDGITALEEIRKNPTYDPIRIIMVTTSTIESEIARCSQLGANGFLTKPVDTEILRNTMIEQGCSWAVSTDKIKQ